MVTTPKKQKAKSTVNLTTIDCPPISIPSLSKTYLTEPQNLPESSGIYFVCDSANRVWYVGIATTSLRERHSKHEKRELFVEKKCDKICYLAWGNVEDIETWEPSLIERFQPPLNDYFRYDELPIVDLKYDESAVILRYKEIKIMQKALDIELEELKPNLVTFIEQHDGKLRLITEIGEIKAHIVNMPKWSHSDECLTLDASLKTLKKQEKETGIAIITGYTTYPVVR